MNKAECFFVGQIIKTQGIKGEIAVLLKNINSQIFNTTESVFLEIKKELVPFFIENFEILNKNLAVLKFEDVNTVDQAEQYLQCNLYLPLNLLPESDKNIIHPREIIGFTVIDKEYGNIGKIEDIIENSFQSIMVIKSGDKEILIPSVDEIIQKIDRKGKEIFITAPEGLIELYK